MPNNQEPFEVSSDSYDEEEDQIFNVEAIIDHKMEDGETLYRVRWEGYSPDDDTWEPIENLKGCPDKLSEYLDKIRKKSLIKGMDSKKKEEKPSKNKEVKTEKYKKSKEDKKEVKTEKIEKETKIKKEKTEKHKEKKSSKDHDYVPPPEMPKEKPHKQEQTYYPEPDIATEKSYSIKEQAFNIEGDSYDFSIPKAKKPNITLFKATPQNQAILYGVDNKLLEKLGGNDPFKTGAEPIQIQDYQITNKGKILEVLFQDPSFKQFTTQVPLEVMIQMYPQLVITFCLSHSGL